MLNTHPVRRWHLKQWQAQTQVGLPSQGIANCPQLHAAQRAIRSTHEFAVWIIAQCLCRCGSKGAGHQIHRLVVDGEVEGGDDNASAPR
jgi:hypothetical protein